MAPNIINQIIKKIREFSYRFEDDAYLAPDMTLLAEHITGTGNVVEMAYQEEPLAIIWCVRGDGQLIALTYQREQEVVAWHRHIIGGSFGTGNAVVGVTDYLNDANYNGYITITAHGLSTGDEVVYSAGGGTKVI